MKVKFLKNYQKGITMVEILIASAIILLTVVALLSAHSFYLRSAFSNTNSLKATYLAQEGLEVARFLRDASWENYIEGLAQETSYYASLTGEIWTLSTTPAQVENFSRWVTFSPVYRDASGDITTSGGILDLNTKLVTSTVSWNQSGELKTRNISTYLTNLYDN